MLNVVAIMGRLVADPELRTTPQGTSVTTFRIACDRNFVRQGEQRQADFLDVVAWRQQAEFVCRYFQKGSLIAINGNNRTAVEIVADNVNFAGSKSSGGEGGYAPSQAQSGQGYSSRGAMAQQPAPSFSSGSNEDFAVIDDNEDLPF